ncbi:efflux RND transporter permease subunit [Rhodobacter capsulatus]|uniref:Acriflavin resistance protein family n=1 Tax=Rhodobacter capsulatus (strain ATCC BAA-309 / NBRC 16581 / SB1003) TaxID=272942 RepID=D5AT90_RHOCB|nr:efflux RND transporter permease subunit [Rhodobacter capsulatus]ADE85197.1 acriflavin resistance protein family [Rhodobacter capsulatus SB 1003]ETD01928.1 multidrug transporter AcrB [Rhodobacter capsulatus DE442]ETD77347.1 multidrug transporter AcrB [Rhodobacter capsulatus R121]ETE53928.1 multidrug transporter AcrB [Rhodobacter capsulatus Y262]MDS0926850.1 efflux RND transporter permease subunit [Rhodobacter capsulatus]
MNDPREDDLPTAGLGLAGRLTRGFIGSALTPLFVLAALAVGLVALGALPREEEPQISVPMVDIHLQAPGLKAEDAMKLVTEPMETIITSINEVEHVYSQTNDDAALVMARFIVGTSSDAAILRVHEKVKANLDRIPKGIPEPIIVGRGIDDVAIMSLTLSARPGSPIGAADLTRIARELQTEVTKIENVGLTYLVGEAREVIRIAPDPERLALYGITLQQLSAKVEQANRSFSTGRLRDQGQQIDLVAGKTLTAPAEIAGLLLTARDGRPVYVADVADVAYVPDTSEHLVANVTRAGDQLTRSPAVTLAIAKRAGANAVIVGEKIHERLAELEGSLIPESVDLAFTRDYGETANEKANELLFHLGLATISIIALVFFAIGGRESIVVAIVIPVTILLTLFAANAMGFTLNRVSLFALIFSIGILVDDAIVVIENIARHWAMPGPGSRVRKAIEAVAEVGNPTIVATLTVVAALLPMLAVAGLMGPYMSPIPAVASAAMVFSFFVAVIITPWLMVKIAGRADMSGHEGGAHAHGGKLGALYARVARPVLATKRASWAFLLATIVLSFGSLGLLYTKDVTVKLLPFDNKSELSVVIDLPEGSSVEATDAVAQQVAAAVTRLPEVISVQTHAGTASPFNFNGLVRHYYLRGRPWEGDVQINLAGKDARDRTSHEIALQVRQIVTALPVPAGTVLKTVEPPPGPPVIATLLAEVYGPDAETRRAAAGQIETAFRSVPFVVDVDTSFGEQARRLRATIDPDNLDFYAVEESDVFDTLGLLNGQTTVGYSHRGAERMPLPIVMERAKGAKVMDAATLSTPIPANLLPGARGVVELGDVVTVTPETTSFPIFRHNGRAAEMVTAELAGTFEAPLYGMLAVGEAIEAMDWAPGTKPEISLHGQPEDESHVTLLWDGEWEVTWVTFRDMGGAFGIALVGIYILVVAQFGSFRLPLVVLTPVPLTFLGIMLGHMMFSAPFSATSMIGFIALAGIIVRNSILLVDFIRHADRTGKTEIEILIEAGAIRFKPILLTAVAAMIGAAVILFDPIFQGLAISLLFGLLSSTLLTVLVIPAIYRIFKT